MNTIKNKLKQEYEYNQENARLIRLKNDKENYESCLSFTHYLKKNIKNGTFKSGALDQTYFTKCDEFTQLIKSYKDANIKAGESVNYISMKYDDKTDKVNINMLGIDREIEYHY